MLFVFDEGIGEHYRFLMLLQLLLFFCDTVATKTRIGVY